MTEETKQNKGRSLVDRKLIEAPSNFIADRPKAAFSFGPLVVLDVLCGYILFYLLDIKIQNI